MINSPFFHFVLIQLYRYRSKYIPIFIISTLLISLIGSFLFLSKSIQYTILQTLKEQPSLIVQKIDGGRVSNTPTQWIDQFLEFEGVTQATQRVYGRYFYESKEEYFTIIGVDIFQKQITKDLSKIVENLNIDQFLSKNYMIIGKGVEQFLNRYQFYDWYTFRPPNRSIQKVYIYKQFKNDTGLVTNDIAIMDIDLAKKILGIKNSFSTDIALTIPNKNELETVINKIKISHFDSRVITVQDNIQIYTKFFNFKSSIFILLFLIVLITFIILIYLRYSLISSSEIKDIAILRSLGWSISQIIKLKIIENLILFSTSFILGINLAYIYVFNLNAPILKEIFLGFNNLNLDIKFIPSINIETIITIFLIFIIPILGSILFPIWKIAILDPHKSIK